VTAFRTERSRPLPFRVPLNHRDEALTSDLSPVDPLEGSFLPIGHNLAKTSSEIIRIHFSTPWLSGIGMLWNACNANKDRRLSQNFFY